MPIATTKHQAFRERNRKLDEPSPRLRARAALAEMPGDELRSEVLGLSRRLTSSTYELLVLVGELDARGTWVLWGALSCAAWLIDIAESTPAGRLGAAIAAWSDRHDDQDTIT